MTAGPPYTFDLARRTTRTYAKTFFFSSHMLPREKRDGAYAVYAFCRHADNLADDHAGDGALVPGDPARFDALRNELIALYEGTGKATRWPALRETIARYDIPRQYFDALIDGVEMDLEPRVFHTFAELDLYCYRVASVVGLIMSHILGATTEEALRDAAHLGTAMQLTNILRDVGEDFRMGRIYLPRDEMSQFGVSEKTIETGVVTDGMRRLLQFHLQRARDYYRMAEPGIALLPDDGSRLCVSLMGALYARILDAIERNDYDVFSHRAHVPFRTKCRVAFSMVTLRPDRSSRRQVEPPRGTATTEQSRDVSIPTILRSSRRM